VPTLANHTNTAHKIHTKQFLSLFYLFI